MIFAKSTAQRRRSRCKATGIRKSLSAAPDCEMNRAGTISLSGDGMRPFEPLWPPFVAMLAIGGLYAALPSSLLAGGQRWLLFIVVGALIVPILLAHHYNNHALNQLLGYVLNGIVTLALIISLALLINQVTEHKVTPPELLRSAAALW